MSMTIRELQYRIENALKHGGLTPDSEVRMGIQPEFPLQSRVNGTAIDDGILYILEEAVQVGPADPKLWDQQ